MSDEIGCKNTDKEIWREKDSFYSDSIHVTELGGIGLNCGGSVRVLPIRSWFGMVDELDTLHTALASRDEEVKGLEAQNEQLKYQVCNLLCGEWANGGNHKEGCALRGEDK